MKESGGWEGAVAMETRRSSSRGTLKDNGSLQRSSSRQRQRQDWRDMYHPATSDEDSNRLYAASLMHTYSARSEGSYRMPTDQEGGGGSPSAPSSPTIASHFIHGSPSRQASPYPIESTNLSQSGQSTPQPGGVGGSGVGQPSPRYAAGRTNERKKGVGDTTGTRKTGTRRRHLASSSSGTSSSASSDLTYPEVERRPELRNELCEESPPEPAPPEVPPRGPSLTLRSARLDSNSATYVFPSQDYLMPGSPRSYPGKSPEFSSASDINNPANAHLQHRLGGGTLGSSGGGLAGGGGGQVPVAMPVFPLRPPASAPSAPHYSPYSPSRFHIDKRCQHRCTWKCCSIALILICVVLTGMLAYFGAVNSMRTEMDRNSCILVEDAKAVAQDESSHDPTAASQTPTEESVLTSTAVHYSGPSPSQPASSTDTQQWQSSTVEIKDFRTPHVATIQPAHFWNSEFRNKQPAFIRFNMSLPWGANFAVYGRRNVAPSITQYDFFEFVKGGRVDHRLKRSLLFDSQELLGASYLNAVSFTTLSSDKSKGEQIRETLEKNEIPVEESDENESEVEKPVDKSKSNSDESDNVDEPDKDSSTDPHKVSKRSTGNIPLVVNVTLLQYLDTGRWFLSVYNDDLRSHEIVLIVEEAEGISTACPNDCSGHGSCYLGKCDCIDGYEGIDCSKSVCPVLCSNHGKYGGGLCHCEEGWKGAECDIPEHDCQVADCSGHGKCVSGSCECNAGWKGLACNVVDCPQPQCSGHGTCVEGKCYCKAGWQGVNCSLLDQQVYQCLPSCSEHGSYDLETGACVCEEFWTGPDCSQAVCSLDCGPNGRCDQGQCVCKPGWSGERCDLLPCDSRCSEHGQCKNGTCVCSQGWNGRHCTLPGCLNSCNRNGICALEDGEYHCQCNPDWAGSDCSVQLETECNDEIDNDHDGMADCSDSECCTHPVCRDHIMCLASNDPVEVLLRKQPPSVTASFYQRVKFLVEENSVQSYVHKDEYTERRVSVIRGQVLSPQALGIIGIRVSVDRDSRFGFTLTRAGGWFDVLVNGGGAVTLQFQRSPFQPVTKTLFVPWNQIVVLPPITMLLSDESEGFHPTPSVLALGAPGLGAALHSVGPCLDHDDTLLVPVILSTWMPEKVGGHPGQNLLFAETQMLQESIRIPGSGLHLMYRSSLASGYLSRIVMRLTHSQVPPSLLRVHVRVEVEGSVHTKIYEADPNLTHTFAWNKRNVYKQKVYGVAEAKVSVGYEHSTCPNIVWETQTATLQGFEVDISDVGGWSLDIHHHYNFHEGILQKGDGSTLHLKQFPRTVRVVMGTGLQRPLHCKDCDGLARDARLLTPVALTSGPDGSLYVGDFNLVRRLTPQGTVYTILQLSATQVSYQYYLSLSPADGHLYISDPEKHQILRVVTLESVADPAINWEAVVGSGERCIPGDENSCGDEGPAKSAKLAHPKGLAIAADKTMYIADGTNIRSVDPDGIIHTLIGHHRHHNVWQPIPCKGAIPAQQAQLQWPTGLALSPLDGTLHFIDDRLVLKITADLKVKVIAGTPLHCHAHKSDQSETTSEPEPQQPPEQQPNEDGGLATSTSLGQVLALAFSPSGQLFIADSDSRKVNAIRVVDSSGRMSDFAGRGQLSDKRECDCMTNITTNVPCPCWTDASTNSRETLLSTTARFTTISALAVSPDGVVNVADQGNLHILSLEHYLASHDENGEFTIPYTATGEEYVFNRYGQHIATKDITTGKTRYTFLYSKNTSFGKLLTVTDSSGNKILFLRDYSNLVSAIENTQDHKCDLNISGVGFLTKFSEKGRSEVVLDYDSNTGLLTSRSDSMPGGGSTYIYQYDTMGRVRHVVLPSGETLNLASKLTADDELEVQISTAIQSSVASDSNMHIVNIKMEGQTDKRMTVRDSLSGVSEAMRFSNGSLWMVHRWGGITLVTAEAKHPLLELSLPVEAEMFPVWSRQLTKRGDIANTMAWTYTLVGDAGTSQQTLHRQLWVNNTRVLGVEYDQAAGKETVYDKDKEPLLSVTFDPAGLPLSWRPGNSAHPVNITYDRMNRVEGWTWGAQSETYSYDRHGLLAEIKTIQDGTTQYTYNTWNMLSKISLPSGRKFTLVYDEMGGLQHVTLPSGTRHSFSAQPSLGFCRYTYTAPGSTRAYLQHYSHSGALLQTVYPGDGARVLYRYHSSGKLAEIVHGDGITQIKQLAQTGLPSQVLHSEKDFEYRWDYQYSGGLLTEERLDYGPKTGLSNAKLTYQYDDNFRITSIQGRIGGQSLPEHSIQYSPKTGAKVQIGPFAVSWPQPNITSLSDGTAVFSRTTNEHFQITQVAVTIHRMEVHRMEFTYDTRNRISQTRTYTRNVGVNTYTNVKNLTWDADGQLAAVEAQEPWGFKYDPNGNMLSLTYRGNTIPMEYNVMDRIVKFGEGLYRYDNRGLVVQNAREEKFHYNAKGLLVRATKRGRFDVRYYYDHLDRLATRKDNYGNVTQFFYTNHQRLNQVTQIYSPRDGKLMSLVYDDRGHLIYAQVFRHKYYVATDQCGTPVMVFNQYGEGIREIMRSPYGHIVYDSNPYLYLPVDFCGGLLDQVTSLVHMSGGKVYDPLIGQWMSPMWENILDRVTNPRHLHLYRFNGNDPINVGQDSQHLTDEVSWLTKLGYDLNSLAPQLTPQPPPHTRHSPPLHVASGFVSHLTERMMTQGLSSLARSRMRLDPFAPDTPSPITRHYSNTDPMRELVSQRRKVSVIEPGSVSEPVFGRGILVSRTAEGRAVVHSVPSANAIYRDVITSVFNNTYLLPFSLVVHGALQDAFYFVKEDAWRAQEDRAQLKRFGSQFNTTFHEKDGETGSGKVLDVRIHRPTAVVNLRYGTTVARERQRLLHHARAGALKKAWHRERDALRNGVPTSRDWPQADVDDILKSGVAAGYDGEYVRDVDRYPELAEDPFNIRFVKKSAVQAQR